jgi:Fe-S-cluster containining protein
VENAAYECDGCGACCRTFPVYASAADGDREPRIRAEGLRLAEQLVTPRWTFQLFPLPFHETCCFLDAGRRCDIYATRPDLCREFPVGGGQCQEARRRAGLPALQPVANLGGP